MTSFSTLTSTKIQKISLTNLSSSLKNESLSKFLELYCKYFLVYELLIMKNNACLVFNFTKTRQKLFLLNSPYNKWLSQLASTKAFMSYFSSDANLMVTILEILIICYLKGFEIFDDVIEFIKRSKPIQCLPFIFARRNSPSGKPALVK